MFCKCGPVVFCFLFFALLFLFSETWLHCVVHIGLQLTMQLRLQTHSDLPASLSGTLGLQACTTLLDFQLTFFCSSSCHLLSSLTQLQQPFISPWFSGTERYSRLISYIFYPSLKSSSFPKRLGLFGTKYLKTTIWACGVLITSGPSFLQVLQ